MDRRERKKKEKKEDKNKQTNKQTKKEAQIVASLIQRRDYKGKLRKITNIRHSSKQLVRVSEARVRHSLKVCTAYPLAAKVHTVIDRAHRKERVTSWYS